MEQLMNGLDDLIRELKENMGTHDTVSMEWYDKASPLIRAAPDDALKRIVNENIKFLKGLAVNEINRRAERRASAARNEAARQWMVKCDDCRKTIRMTENVQESNEGGTCDECKARIRAEGKKGGYTTMWDSVENATPKIVTVEKEEVDQKTGKTMRYTAEVSDTPSAKHHTRSLTYEGYRSDWQQKNDVPEDEKQGLIESMKEPAMKHSVELAMKNGMVSAGALQKMVTRDGFPKPIPIKYIMPGLVEYEYMNNGAGARVLVTKTALDKMLNDPEKSIVGKPVINTAHRDVSPDDYQNGEADGIVTRAWYEPNDGWYYCEALIWDEDTRRNIQNGHSVSCEYTALPPWGPAGTLNQVAYDKEVTDGRYKHLAVVSGPRYEGAAVQLMNSTGGSTPMTKLFQWLKKGDTEVKNAVDVDARTAIEIDGAEVPLANAITAWKESEAAKAKAKADADALALKNAKVLTDADSVTIDGKTVSVAELRNAMAAKVKNEADDKLEKDHKDGDHKEKDVENCSMCNAEEDEKDKKKKEDEDAKNAVLMNSQHRMGQHVQPNEKCAICDGIQAERLSNAAKMRKGELPNPANVPSLDDGLKRGREMFGKTKAQQDAAAAKAA